MDDELQNLEMMSIASYLYYYEDMNQNEIASRLFLSRSTVSRLIKKARQVGIIELKIKEPWSRDLAMEDAIKTRFPLRIVRVLREEDDQPEENALDMLGKMAAFVINCDAHPEITFGLSWGTTIQHVVDSLKNNQHIPMTVVPIMGTMSNPNMDPASQELSRKFAKIYGGRFFPLDAPLFASDVEQREQYLADPDVQQALSIARKADVILTSVGSIESRSWELILGRDRLQRLTETGCVGHIGGHFFDENGQEINSPYKELHIGLSLEEIRSTDHVMCVAASEKKAAALRGALKGGLVQNLLITRSLAAALLEMEE